MVIKIILIWMAIGFIANFVHNGFKFNPENKKDFIIDVVMGPLGVLLLFILIQMDKHKKEE